MPKILNPSELDTVEARRIPFDGAVSTQTVDDLVATARALWGRVEALEGKLIDQIQKG